MNSNIKLPSQLITQEDIDKINRMFKIPSSKESKNKEISALLCPIISKHFYNVRTSFVNSRNVRHDQSFMGYRPTVSKRFSEASVILYNNVIGEGASNDVNLSMFGHCNHLSSRHAEIFYNKSNGRHELINYSPYGTFVNNTLYGHQKMEWIVQQGLAVGRGSSKFKIITDHQAQTQCSCTPSHYEFCNSSWQGSIPLTHGSVLRFGCISFVFSLIKQ